MVDKKAIIDILNEILTAELTAINQYFLHAELCRHWGYNKLHGKIYAESIDEMKHAQTLMERILYLDGMPNVQRLGKVSIGETVPEIFKADLAMEHEAIPRLNRAIELCRTEGDNGTRVILDAILASEEEHADWLEIQIALIEKIGEAQYLAQQMG